MALDEVFIALTDLEDVRQVLAAVLVYFQAEDLQIAQQEFRTNRPSPLTQELERVKGRFDGYLGDYLLREHEASLAETEDDTDSDSGGAEEGAEDATEASEELSSTPLGDFTAPKQRGRRLKQEDL